MKLAVNNLTTARSGRVIFDNLSFVLESGNALIITGTNGSGKSTLLRSVCGLLEFQSGEITLDYQSYEHPHEAMHYLGHQNALKSALSIGENLSFWRDYCGDPLAEINEALDIVGLGGMAHLPAQYLSAGQKRRVAIAKLLISDKPVWVVDEPTAALDTASEKMFEDMANDHLSRGGMLLAATHQPLNITPSAKFDMDGYAR